MKYNISEIPYFRLKITSRDYELCTDDKFFQ